MRIRNLNDRQHIQQIIPTSGDWYAVFKEPSENGPLKYSAFKVAFWMVIYDGDGAFIDSFSPMGHDDAQVANVYGGDVSLDNFEGWCPAERLEQMMAGVDLGRGAVDAQA